MPFFRSNPKIVEAMQWTGTQQSLDELAQWVGGVHTYSPDLILSENKDSSDLQVHLYVAANEVSVPLEIGEWVIKDELGFYPCKDVVFRKNYDAEESVEST